VTPISQRLAVVGLGLLGGSVALAARRRGVAAYVVGATRSAEARRRALEGGAVDEIVSLESVAAGADLIVLATPLYAMSEVLRRIAPAVGRGAVVTDVGSVKAPLTDTLPGLLPPGAHYVGSHPMAGSHERGMDAAREDLLEGAPCIVTEMDDAEAIERVCAFWTALGSRVVRRAACDHDVEVAWMSHLPHILAFAFARALDKAPDGAPEVAGSGYRDFTRIAHSDPELWADILATNRKALGAPLQIAGETLSELSRLLEAGDAEALERWLVEARSTLSLASRDSQRRTKTDS
jgi:prephenate dehydrogenase